MFQQLPTCWVADVSQETNAMLTMWLNLLLNTNKIPTARLNFVKSASFNFEVVSSLSMAGGAGVFFGYAFG